MKPQKVTYLLFLFFITILFLFSCGYSYKIQLNQIDSLLSKNLLDSAATELEFINADEISNDEDLAHYYLLKVQTLWRLYKPIESDSTLNFCINHYKETHEYDKLANSLYYKGAILQKSGDLSTATKCYKNADFYALRTNDDDIKFKIYFNLSIINKGFNDHKKALEYSHKAFHLAQKTHRYDWMVYCCEHLSGIYIETKKFDSAQYYIEKSLPIIKHIKKEDQAFTYTNLAILLKYSNKEKAKEYLYKALSIDTITYTLNNLAQIYISEGKEAKAFRLWNKAIETEKENADLTIEMLRRMQEQHISQGRYKEALDVSIKAYNVRDSIEKKWNEENLKELQMKYDIEAKDKEIESQRNIFILYIAVLILISILLYLIYIYKTTKNKQQIAEDKMLISAYEKEIEQLRTSGKNVEKEVERLNKKISDSRQRNAGILQKGYQLYNDIVEGGTVVRWSKSYFEYFMEYYGTIDIVFVNRLETEYYKLSPKYMFFSTLYHMGKSDEEVERIMGISSNTIRSTKSRINSKRLTDSTEMPDMLFVKE